MLSFYRAALAARRSTAALGGTGLVWGEGTEEDVLIFRRDRPGEDALWCAGNLGTTERSLRLRGDVVIASGPLGGAGDEIVRLPPDTAVWIVEGRA
jgi:alpha-glucosidase